MKASEIPRYGLFVEVGTRDVDPNGNWMLASDVEKVFPSGVAFMPVPRCSDCRHWEDGAPMEFVEGSHPKGRWGYCHLIATKDYEPVNPEALAFRDTESAPEHAEPLYTNENFGCVQFEAKPDPAQ